jgi:hypothetical protein
MCGNWIASCHFWVWTGWRARPGLPKTYLHWWHRWPEYTSFSDEENASRVYPWSLLHSQTWEDPVCLQTPVTLPLWAHPLTFCLILPGLIGLLSVIAINHRSQTLGILEIMSPQRSDSVLASNFQTRTLIFLYFIVFTLEPVALLNTNMDIVVGTAYRISAQIWAFFLKAWKPSHHPRRPECSFHPSLKHHLYIFH